MGLVESLRHSLVPEHSVRGSSTGVLFDGSWVGLDFLVLRPFPVEDDVLVERVGQSGLDDERQMRSRARGARGNG